MSKVVPWFVPMKVSEILRLLEQDGWTLKRVTGSYRHYTHPAKAALAMVEHLALLRELGQPVPEPADSASVTILDPAAA